MKPQIAVVVALLAATLVASDALADPNEDELRELELKVADLKERIFSSKSRIRAGGCAIHSNTDLLGARVHIWHVDELSRAYEVQDVRYTLDGQVIFDSSDHTVDFGELESVHLYDQMLTPGAHTLQVQSVVRGNGRGIFSYTRGYAITVQPSHKLHVDPGQLAVVNVRMSSRGGGLKPFTERPHVDYGLVVSDLP